MNFHTLKVSQVLHQLRTSEKGLSEKEARRRLKKYGHNRLPQEKKLGKLMIFFLQFKSPLIYILAIAGVVTLLLHEYTDSLVIWLAVAVNTLVGFAQENKANDSLSKLKEVVKNRAIVVYNEGEREIDQEDLVVGDIVVLRAGDKVPADGRLLEANDLSINESVLTGEWQAVEKKVGSLKQETFFADRTNLAYMGTMVESGFGRMVVIAIGRHTEFGKVAKLINDTDKEQTPYQKKLSRFSTIIGSVVLLVCLIIFVEGMLSGGEFSEIFTVSVAVAVAAIPEGLPIAMTVILAIGMQKILKRNGLVRRLASAETLGSTSIICSDKTGTLTEGNMEVADVISADEKYNTELPHREKGLKAHRIIYNTITLLSEAFIENPNDKINDWILRGRPTDQALLMAGYLAGFSKSDVSKRHQEIVRLPFSSKDKFSAAFFSNKNNYELMAMGAPEIIFEKSSHILIDGKKTTLTSSKLESIKNDFTDMTAQGLRVLAISYRLQTAAPKNKKILHDEEVDNLIFIGFVALKDHLRDSAKETIKICRQSGLKPVIITGDHKLTARAIALELGLKSEEKNILEGKDLEKMTDTELFERITDITIFARVRPEHKLRIVNAWQARGKVVAMTGDGINDAPALKKADVGVVLGSGTAVAKEVADLVLLSNDFSVIVAAIEEGRVIIDNIRKVITYLMSSSFTEIILISSAIIFGWPMPVLAVHILWVNLIQDGLPNIALAFEPKETEVMKRPPLPKNLPLLNNEMKFIIFFIGIFTDIILLWLFYYMYHYTDDSITHIRSIIFAALAISSTFYIYSCKNLRKNIWQVNLFSNKSLLLTTLIGLVLLAAVFYVPMLQTIFQTVPLKFYDWLILVAFGMINIVFIEIAKLFYIKNSKVA